jgi:fido (protein-threonine AMPylation protein)
LHRRIFNGVFKHAGQIRTYDITKKEFVLRGGTVNYLNHEDLRAAWDYDIAQEKPFSYKGMTSDEMVAHITHFVGDLWQIHAFGEGNTRTTAVFTILYLRSIGFDVNNDLFAAHSKYFRDALVRANYKNAMQGIDYSPIYLERFFRNLLLGEKWVLKSRYLVINPPAEFAEQPREDAGKLQKPAQMRENDAGKLQKPAFKTETIRRVYELICSNPRIKQAQMATILHLDDSTIERATAWLRKNGYINREHSKIKGEWQLEP